MPNICFSYSSDVPQGTRNRGAAPSAIRDIQRMQHLTPCFSYSSEVPLGIRHRGAEPRDLRDIQRMQTLTPCFSY